MKSSRLLLLCAALALVAGCGGGGGSGGSVASPASSVALPNGPTLPQVVGDNVLTLTINGSECSAATFLAYPNKPCVSVTICDPGNPGNCQVVNDILLDTMDYGLRIFQQVLTQPGLLTALSQNPVQVGPLPVYECTQYGDGSAVWGPVQQANVRLANEPAVTVPVQVIGSSAGNPSQVCAGAFSSPADALYNGSLGLGFFVQDCGPACAPPNTGNGQYFTCSGGACTGTAVPLGSQVQNPVASLPLDNNGVTVMLPGVPSGGSPSATGYVVLGIGTRSNNSPPSWVTAYGANPHSGNFTTVFNGVPYNNSFIDSGSNGLFFPDNQIQTCSGWFCPPSVLSLSATTTGAAGSPSGVVQFQIGNFNTLSASSNNVFSSLGAPQPGSFDWGIPFFLGRNVYVGLEGTPSSLGTGPYWAY